MLTLEVIGTPAPKGSSRAMLIGGQARNVPSGSNANRDKLKSWKQAIADAVGEVLTHYRDAVGAERPLYQGPLVVGIVYRFPMRAGDLWKGRDGVVYGPRESSPMFLSVKPDCDKLDRSTLDAITAAGGVWNDDAQIAVKMSARVYTPPGHSVGATVIVNAMGTEDHPAGVHDAWQRELVEAQRVLELAKINAASAAQQARAARRKGKAA